MEPELFKVLGQIAGLGGISLGVFLLLFRDVIRKKIFPTLPPEHAYRVIRLAMILTFLIALVGVAAWVYVSRTGPQTSEPKETVITDPQITPSRIPTAMLEPLPNITGDALGEELKRRGSLTLDGSTLTLGKIGAHIIIAIACHTLRLQNGARIVTNGNVLDMHVVHFLSSGGSGIVSFDGDGKKAPNGAAGGPGFPGEHGGRVSLQVLASLDGRAQISLPGQNGGNGGRGLPGNPGAAGERGADAVQGFMDCRSGGQDGRPGGQGERGGPGGDGGRGGDGGQLALTGNIISSSSVINFEAPGGPGGDGGDGGPGGPGGPGGQGGSGGGQCSGGRAGAQGPSGAPGPKGQPGQNGRAGSIINY